MTREEVGALFVEMLPKLRQVAQEALRRRDDDAEADVLHDALVVVLGRSFADRAAAMEAIYTVVQQTAYSLYHERRREKRLFPDPSHWRKGGRAVGGSASLDPEGPQGNPIDHLPDDRPNPEEVVLQRDAVEPLAALARRMGHDSSWRGELYQLLYIEELRTQEIAKRLGITVRVAQKRIERLREWLKGRPEGKRIVKRGRC